MRLGVRHFVPMAAVAALVAASGASAMQVRPATQVSPAFQISDAAAKASKDAPVCPNGLVCYHPSHLKDAYNFPSGRKAPTGERQTILIVTSYGLPTIETDLAQFNAEEGLPPADFTEVDQQAPPLAPGDPTTIPQWMAETALDVEYAHAMAPSAKIVLAVAATDDSADVTQVLREVLPKYPGAIVSMSLFADEFLWANLDPDSLRDMNAMFMKHVLTTGGSVVAAAGDYGATGLSFLYGDPMQATAYPASSIFAVGVGGTMGGQYPLGLWQNGRYGSEQVWNEPDFQLAGGGGPSQLFRAPLWQFGITGQSKRAVPDVSYNAAVNGGVVIVIAGHHTVMGGTSAGTPQWAAIIALANELRGKQGRSKLGLATPQLYAIARDRGDYRQDFHDITVGNNDFVGQLPGFDADPGYDLATGLGTPNVTKLLSDIAGRDGGRWNLDDRFDGDRGRHSSHKHFRLGG